MILVLVTAITVAYLVLRAMWIGRRQPRDLPFQGRLSNLLSDSLIRDLLCIAGIGGATGLFFWRLLAGQVFMPAGGGDLAQFLYPTYSFAAEWWRRGFIPLWNPYLFGGSPFVGDNQSGIFYPINLLAFLVSAPLTFRDLELLSVLHFTLAGVGMYLFLQHGNIGIRSRAASLLGAVAFEFSDLFVTHFGNLNLIAVAAWMPLVLLTYRRALTDRRVGMAILAGVVLSAAFYAGHIQSFLFIIIAVGLLMLYEVLTVGWRRPLGMFVLMGAITFGLTAPVLLPSIEMAQQTLRTSFPYEQAVRFSLPPAELIGLVVPGFFGRGPSNYWAPWDRVEVGYIGVLPLALAALAIVLRREAFTRLSAVVALVGLALALGGYAILQGWLYQFVPGFGQLRAPARAIFLFDFGVATLAALGLDVLLHQLGPELDKMLRSIVSRSFWVLVIVVLVSGAAAYSILILGQSQDAVLYARMANAVNAIAFSIILLILAFALIALRSRSLLDPWWGVLAVVLVFFDLFSLGAYVDASAEDPARVFEHPEAVAFLQSNLGIARIDGRETGVDSVWPADTSILYGFSDVNGENPLVLGEYEKYWQALGSRSTALYDLLNVKYLIARKSAPVDRSKFQLAFDGDPAFNIYENTRVLPRAFIVNKSISVPNPDAASAAIHAADFDPAQTVILENGPVASNARDAAAAVNITGYAPNEIRLTTNSASGGFLVLSETYYPGWRAWIDDREVSVMRADGIFRSVELSSGSHSIRLVYDPVTFRVGVVLFVLTSVSAAVWAIRDAIRKSARSSRSVPEWRPTG